MTGLLQQSPHIFQRATRRDQRLELSVNHLVCGRLGKHHRNRLPQFLKRSVSVGRYCLIEIRQGCEVDAFPRPHSTGEVVGERFALQHFRERAVAVRFKDVAPQGQKVVDRAEKRLARSTPCVAFLAALAQSKPQGHAHDQKIGEGTGPIGHAAEIDLLPFGRRKYDAGHYHQANAAKELLKALHLAELATAGGAVQ